MRILVLLYVCVCALSVTCACLLYVLCGIQSNQSKLESKLEKQSNSIETDIET
ncbi:hypothetical protein HanRHA438_Chr09g0394211 [Helianthus annuus]|nr:hypothetical protein HanRHA438_Chr09g0394211 [Helianthus annuus]